METKEIIIPDDWEVKEVVGNKIIIREKEKELPKTYNECVNRFGEYITITTNPPKESTDAIRALCKLLTCRNAWWEQLGWKPDWSNCSKPFKWCIHDNGGFVMVTSHSKFPRILAFPDRETSYMFLETFRDLIEEAKELL